MTLATAVPQPAPSHRGASELISSTAVSQRGSTLTVTAVDRSTPDVVAITLGAPDGARLPEWAPGAHIDLHVPGHGIRQYSLCGDRWDAHCFRIAVKRDVRGRGGSDHVVATVQPGDEFEYGGPRNTFRQYPAGGYVFVAGGIGITPILPMIDKAERMGLPWHCLALSKTRETMPFAAELAAYGDRVSFIESSTAGRCDLARELRPHLDGTTAIYACGPDSMLDALTALADDLPLPVAGMRIERFAAEEQHGGADDAGFELVLARFGRQIPVHPGQSALSALREAGLRVLASCERGLCGTCEVDVVDGVPDHRDSVLAEHEQQAGDCMMVCVSRARTPRLTIDL